MSRRVLYAEVPAFYAEIERAADPERADRPVVVGGDPRKRGLVQSATADALAAGVAPDMPMLEALRRCPRARPVRTDMARYREVSRRLFACLRREGGELEPAGLAGAYLALARDGDAGVLARRLREAVARELGLPLRVGIASGKFLARLAAEEAGEGAVRRIPPGGEAGFLAPLPVTRLDGVGQRTAAALAELGARTIGEVAALPAGALERALGTHGLRIHAYATGADEGPVHAAAHPRSLSREATVDAADARDRGVLVETLLQLSARLEEELRRQGLAAQRVVLRLRAADGGSLSRSATLRAPLLAAAAIHRVAVELLDRTPAGRRPVRGLGLQLGRLAPAEAADRQLELFSSGE